MMISRAIQANSYQEYERDIVKQELQAECNLAVLFTIAQVETSTNLPAGMVDRVERTYTRASQTELRPVPVCTIPAGLTADSRAPTGHEGVGARKLFWTHPHL
jgi:hypothetical protein